MATTKRRKIEGRLSIAKLGRGAFSASGRRKFLAFRDLQVAKSTAGKFGAVVIRARKSMLLSTGWHYHVCKAQVIYMLKGWAEMEFENGDRVVLRAGSCINIPSGMLHNEIRISADMEALEFTSPAVMKTIATDPPKLKSA